MRRLSEDVFAAGETCSRRGRGAAPFASEEGFLVCSLRNGAEVRPELVAPCFTSAGRSGADSDQSWARRDEARVNSDAVRVRSVQELASRERQTSIIRHALAGATEHILVTAFLCLHGGA